MRRILFQRWGLTVYAYPAMLYLGLVAGVFAGGALAATANLDPTRVMIATIVLVAPALVGARLLFVLAHWPLFRTNPARIFNRSEGGAGLYGGFLLSLAASVLVLPLFKLPFAAFWDLAAVTILVGMVPTKIGCLLNGCCAGQVTEGWLAMRSPNLRGQWARRVPAQLLEAAWAVVLLVAIALSWSRRPFDGAVFLAAVIGYASARTVLESIREGSEHIGSWRVHQLISVVLIVASFAGFIALWSSQ